MTDVVVNKDSMMGIVELNRPPDDSFDVAPIRRLAAAFENFVEGGARSILLCAVGRNFCADANFQRPDEDEGRRADADHLYREAVKLFRCPLPIVAAVQGAAVEDCREGVVAMADRRLPNFAGR